MDVRLNDEHTLVQQTAARLATDHALLVAPADIGMSSDDGAWTALRDTGFLAMHAPEGVGGGGASALDVALVAEQLASRLCPVPFVAQAVLGPELLALSELGDLVAGVAAGSQRVAVALDAHLDDIARVGEPGVAWDAAHATHALLFDETDRLCWCEIVGDALPTLDRTRVVRTIDKGSSITASPLAKVAVTADDRARFDALAYTVIAADLVGVMQSAVDSAVSYVRDRVQFGAAVGSFQAVQHLAADAAVLLEGSRSSMWHAAWAVDALAPIDARLAARQAKAYCSRAARQVVEISVQLHGGIAITWEHLAHVRVRRALFLAASFGDERAHLRAIADARLGEERGGGGTLMDYRDNDDEAQFRSQLRAWLAEHARIDAPPRDADERMAYNHRWHRALAGGGWLGLSFPVEYGGQGRSLIYDAILNDELGVAGLPPVPAINHITNAIRLFGSEEQKRTHLPGLLSCAVLWCQGFSEPNAGSDLSSLRTRGVRVVEAGAPDVYRIEGQKIWTSEAIWAQWCLLLLRTEFDVPAHRGLSMLMVPMDAPGIECRPIVTSYGSSEFAEVFFTDASVPAANMLGQPGQGWTIAMQLLGFERGPADMGWIARLERTLTMLEARVRSGELTVSASQREALAGAWVELQTLKLHVQRSTGARLDGQAPGPEGSIDKLLMTNADQLLGHVVLDVLAAEAVLDDVVAFPGYVWSRAQSIFGGTQQIQRNIVAQRVLGLPRA